MFWEGHEVPQQRETIPTGHIFQYHIQIIHRLEGVVEFDHKWVVGDGQDVAFVTDVVQLVLVVEVALLQDFDGVYIPSSLFPAKNNLTKEKITGTSYNSA